MYNCCKSFYLRSMAWGKLTFLNGKWVAWCLWFAVDFFWGKKKKKCQKRSRKYKVFLRPPATSFLQCEAQVLFSILFSELSLSTCRKFCTETAWPVSNNWALNWALTLLTYWLGGQKLLNISQLKAKALFHLLRWCWKLILGLVGQTTFPT